MNLGRISIIKLRENWLYLVFSPMVTCEFSLDNITVSMWVLCYTQVCLTLDGTSKVVFVLYMYMLRTYRLLSL